MDASDLEDRFVRLPYVRPELIALLASEADGKYTYFPIEQYSSILATTIGTS